MSRANQGIESEANPEPLRSLDLTSEIQSNVMKFRRLMTKRKI